MKIESGVMIMKNGKVWGINYKDASTTLYDWMDIEYGRIYDPERIKTTADITYENTYFNYEINGRNTKLVNVERRTEVIIKN